MKTPLEYIGLKISFCLLITVLWSNLDLFGQAESSLLDRANTFYAEDQLDSAAIYFNAVFKAKDPNQKMEALSGLIRIAAATSKMERADSLIGIGDQLIQTLELNLESSCKYELSKGTYYRQNTQYDKALEMQFSVLNKSEAISTSRLRADALFYTGMTYERLGKYDSSLYYVEQAYELYRVQLDTTSFKFSEIYNGLANVYYRLNRYADAKENYLLAKKIAENRRGRISTDLAIALNNLSSVSRSEENYTEAIRYSEQALQIFRALKDEFGASGAYYNLGVFHYFIGDYGRAKDYMQACIEIRERLYNDLHASLIGPYQVLGIVYEESGDYIQTLRYLKRAWPIIRANFGDQSIDAGFNFENTALCFQSMGGLDSSSLYLEKATLVLQANLPEDHYALGTHYFSKASISYQLGDYADAFAYLKISNRIYQKLGLDETTEFAQALSLEANILAMQGNWSRAAIQFSKALEIIRLPNEKELGQAFQLSPNALKVLNAYQEFLFRQYQTTGNREALTAFKQYAQQYLDLSDTFRKSFYDPYTKSILMEDNAEVYTRNVGAFSKLYKTGKAVEDLRSVYRFSEYSRTCRLRDLQDEKIQHYGFLPDSLMSKEVALKQAVAFASQSLSDYPDSTAFQTQLFNAKEALNTHIQKIEKDFPQYFAWQFNNQIPSIEEIQSYLSPEQSIIEYTQDDTAYYALVFTKTQSELVYLANRSQVDSWINSWRTTMFAQDKKGDDLFGRLLHRSLWEKLEPYFSGEELTVIPSGPLFYISFEALPGRQKNTFLLQDYQISYALSVSVLMFEQPKLAQEKTKILAVAPGFEQEIKLAYQRQLDSLEIPDESFFKTLRQPWSIQLARKIRKTFGGRSFTGMEARESKVKKALANAGILYFGTHAVADAEDPLRSRLVLAKELGPQIEDGYLYAYELYGLELQADLAILNACESGIGSLKSGEGMISLAYGMHYSGCPSTMMSLWKVDEKVSTQITETCLKYLEKGWSKSAALRQAKLDYLADSSNPNQHPFYWSGMVLMGQDGLVNLKPNRLPNWQLGLFGLLALGVIIFGIRQFKS